MAEEKKEEKELPAPEKVTNEVENNGESDAFVTEEG